MVDSTKDGVLDIDEPFPDWKQVRLLEIALELYSGGTPSTKQKNYWNGDIDWTTSAYINDELYLRTGAKKITNLGLKNSSAKLVSKGNLLIGTRVGVGKVAINSIDVAISQDLTALIVDKDKAVPEYVAYAIRSDRVQNLFHASKRGATIQGITREDLINFPIPLPAIPEQKSIAYVLSSIQEAIEVQERIMNAARELKRSLIHRLFTYGPYEEECPTKETEIGEIPVHWKLEPLGKHVRITSGGTPSRKKPEYWNGSIPWVKTGEINYQTIKSTEEFITKKGLENSSAKLFPPGTLLMAMYGQGITRGRVGILDVEASTNQACAAIFPHEQLMVSYLYWYFSFAYDRIRNFGHGANQKNLSAKIISLIQVPVPPIKEQKEISTILNSVEQKVAMEEEKKRALETLFHSTLHSLMTGQIRVNGTDLQSLDKN